MARTTQPADGSFIRARRPPPAVPLAAVGFDLDDTLCVPVRDRATLLDEAADAVDAPAIDRAEYLAAHRRNLTGETRVPIFAELLDEPTEPTPARLARSYRERVNDAVRPVDGVEELLRTLRGTYAVGLLTNGPSVAQREKLAAIGLTDAFDAVCISGELPAGKPDRRAFEALLDGLGVAAGALVYVGDDPEADIGGATAAGCRAVQVLRDGGPEPDPRAVSHVELEALADELPGVLAGLD